MNLSHPQALIGEKDKIIFSLPKIYVELQEALNDPDKTFQDLGDIIGFDPALSARLLKIVNSPFYRFPSKPEAMPSSTNRNCFPKVGRSSDSARTILNS